MRTISTRSSSRRSGSRTRSPCPKRNSARSIRNPRGSSTTTSSRIRLDSSRTRSWGVSATSARRPAMTRRTTRTATGLRRRSRGKNRRGSSRRCVHGSGPVFSSRRFSETLGGFLWRSRAVSQPAVPLVRHPIFEPRAVFHVFLHPSGVAATSIIERDSCPILSSNRQPSSRTRNRHD
mgnify:CR=1 FL=1